MKAFLLIFFILPATVLANPLWSTTLPDQALEILKRHPVWQTSAGLSLPGYTSNLSMHRKWALVSGTTRLQLKEITKLKLDIECSSKKYVKWSSAELDLDADINTMDYIHGYPLDCKDPQPKAFRVEYLEQDRFVLIPEDVGMSVLFFPSTKTSSEQRPVVKKDVHIFTYPGVPSSVEAHTGLKSQVDGYLHHNLSAPIPVLLDASFPDEFIALLQDALDVWNRQLGADFYRLQLGKRALNNFDCLSTRKLCVFWSGPTQISFLGVSGLANIIFDPESGFITGGTLSFQSEKGPLKEIPDSQELQDYKSGTLDLRGMAKLFFRREAYLDSLHPMPSWNLRFAFSHELGHFTGLAHNFSGSLGASQHRSSDSVMDYLPFSAFNEKSYELGQFDIEVLDLIYHDKALSTGYRFCGDLDSEDPGIEGVSRDPNCNKFDYGRADLWFIELAEASEEGIFSKHPRFNGALIDFLMPFLKLKPTSSSSQQEAVQDYLCYEYGHDATLATLLKQNEIELNCH